MGQLPLLAMNGQQQLVVVVLLLAGSSSIPCCWAQVPGLVYTTNGYDNLRGQDAICWSAPRFYDAQHYAAQHHHSATTTEEELAAQILHHNFTGKQWKNGLVPHFVAGPTTMLASCPNGTSLRLDLRPEEFQQQVGNHRDKLRTHRFYTFHLTLDMDLTTLRRKYELDDKAFFYSDKTTHPSAKNGLEYPLIAVQLQFCPVNGNLCSPFVFQAPGLLDDTSSSYQLAGKIHTKKKGGGHHDEEGDGNSGSEEEAYHQQQDQDANKRDVLLNDSGGDDVEDHNNNNNNAPADEGKDHPQRRYLRPQPNNNSNNKNANERQLVDQTIMDATNVTTASDTGTTTTTATSTGTTMVGDEIPPAPTVLELFERIDAALDIMFAPVVSDSNSNSTTSTNSTLDNNNISSIQPGRLGVVSRVLVSYNETFGFPERIAIDYQKPTTTSSSTLSTTTTFDTTKENMAQTASFSYNDNTVYFATMSHLQPTTRRLVGVQDDDNYHYNHNNYDTYTTHSVGTNSSSMPAAVNTTPITTEDQEEVHMLQQAQLLWSSQALLDYTYQYNVYLDVLSSDDHDDDNHGMPASSSSNKLVMNEQATPYPWSVVVKGGRVQSVVDALNATIFVLSHSIVVDAADDDVEQEQRASDDDDEGEDIEYIGVQEYEEEGDYHDDETGGDTAAPAAEEGSEEDPKDLAKGASVSPRFYIEMDKSRGKSIFQVRYNLDIEVIEPGDYLPMASVMFFLTNETIHGHAIQDQEELALYKFDIATLLHQRVVTYYKPIEKHEVSDTVAKISYVLIGICSIVQLFFLASTIRYRNENVMKLAQSSFLVLLQSSSLVAIIGSSFYRPTSSWSCLISGPLTLIPLQLMFAIIFGRLRRIIQIMEPLMSFNSTKERSSVRRGLRKWKTIMMMGSPSSTEKRSCSNISSSSSEQQFQAGERQRKKSILSRLSFVKKDSFRLPTNRLKQEFSEARLWGLISLVTLPMILVELCALAFFPPELVLVLNEEESIGRYACGDGGAQKFQLASTSILFFTIIMDLYQVQGSRSLPAFFNEASEVSNGLLLSLFVAAMGFAVIIINNGPTGDPNITYMMKTLIIDFVSLNVSIRLTLPKFQLIWNGEKVVVSKILSDHRQMLESRRSSAPQISGLPMVVPSNSSGPMNQMVHDESSQQSMNHCSFGGAVMRDDTTPSLFGEHARCHNSDEKGPTSLKEQEQAVVDSESNNADLTNIPLKAEETRRRVGGKRLVVTNGQAPPTKLTMKIVSHNRSVAKVNNRVLSGLQVENSEWIDLQASVDEFQALLQNVEFR